MDYYSILGVGRTASADEIKRAYRKLAKAHHPDRNPDDKNAERKFKEVQQAYSVLSDPDKRAQFDRFGEAGVGNVSTGTSGQKVYQWGGGSSINFEDLEDLMSAFGGGTQRASVFDQIFGGNRSGRVSAPASQPGADIHSSLELTFEQAVGGASVTVRVPDNRGSSQTLEVKVPAGVDPGQKIRLAGKGQAGRRGGPPGDLFLICSVAPHPFFTRQGADLSVRIPVSVSEAALGGKIEVPTLDGPVFVTLPQGTPSGTKLRLRGKGLSNPRGGGVGDLYAVFEIVPPKSLSDDQRALFEQLREHDGDPRANCAWNEGSSI